ncbi:hypothetical protein ACXJY6_07005 [Vibrio sp. RC27]
MKYLNNVKKFAVLPLAAIISSVLCTSAFAAGFATEFEKPAEPEHPRDAVDEGFVRPSAAALGFSMRNQFAVRTYSLDDRAFKDGEGSEYTTMAYNNVGSYTIDEISTINWWVKAVDGIMGYDSGVSDDLSMAQNEGSELTIAQVYGRVKTDTVDLKVGMMPVFFGGGYNLQGDSFTGVDLEYTLPTSTVIHTFGAITSENDDVSSGNDGYSPFEGNEYIDGDSGTDEDAYAYGIEVGHGNTAGGMSAYYVRKIDQLTNDDKQSVGVAGSYKTGKLRFTGEAMTFFGDDGSGTDYDGTQLVINAKYQLPAGYVNTKLYYAASVDNDKTQQVNIFKQGMVQPFNEGLGQMFDHDDSNLQMFGKPTTPFAITKNSGVIGAVVSGMYKPSKPMTLTGGLMYLVPEDSDNNTEANIFVYDYTGWTSLAILNAAAQYSISDHVSAGVGLSYTSFTAESGSDLDDGLALGLGLVFDF